MHDQPHTASNLGLSIEQLRLFRQASLILTSSLELTDALQNAIGVCLPALGDFGFFDVILHEGVRRTARAHEDPQLQAMLAATSWQRQERTDINLCALSSGQAVLHPNTDDAWFASAFGAAPRSLHFQSMLSVPVCNGSELVGSLTLFMGQSGRSHSDADLHFASELSSLAAPIVVNARLVAQQRDSEAALRMSEQRLRLATDAGNIGIGAWDVAADAISLSERASQLFDVEPADFGGRLSDFYALVHTDDRERVRMSIEAAVAHGTGFHAEFRVGQRNGGLRWLATWARIDRSAEGQATWLTGAILDVTRQKLEQVELSVLNHALQDQVTFRTSERDRIWNMSRDILAIASAQGHFTALSPSFEVQLGWSQAEALGMPLLAFVDPQQHDEWLAAMRSLASGQTHSDFETRWLHKDGTHRWVSWSWVPEGELMFGIGRDVTELRRQRDQLLHASEMRFQLALKFGGMGAWQWNMRDNKVHWWPGMAELHGLPADTQLARVEDYLALVHPEDRALAGRSLGGKLGGDIGGGIEYRVVWPDGSIHWVEGRGDVIVDREGASTFMSGVCVDVTPRKLNEQKLSFVARASAELAELVDHEETLARIARLAVPDFADWCAVDLIDNAGVLKRVSVAHVDPDKVALAHHLHERYPPDPAAEGGTWGIIRSGQSALWEHIPDEALAASIKDPDYLQIIRELGLYSYMAVPLAVRGRTMGVLTFISAESRRSYRNADLELAEEIARRAAVAIDNSTLYRSLQESVRRKDDLLAMLAHELRNPLAPISAAASLLANDVDPARMRLIGDTIARQVAHMNSLVDDLLDVSRVTRGHVKLENEPVDLCAAVRLAVEQVRPLIERKGHAIEIGLSEHPVLVRGDQNRIVQILANLLNNAAKFTPPNGQISLIVELDGGDARIRVRDNGIGMSPELLASAFELFVQGTTSLDRAHGGLGLGLALVKNIVELHGGTVQAFSAGMNFGSEFHVRFPALPSAGATSSLGQHDPSLQHSEATVRRVLVVDDNADAAMMLSLLLEAAGHVVQVVHHPLAALDKLGSSPFDVVLLDVGLPDMDGRELARRIRSMKFEAPQILIGISGYGQAEDKAAALEAGMDHYLIKPVDGEQLFNLLKADPHF